MPSVRPDGEHFGIGMLPLDDLRGPLSCLYVYVDKENICTFLCEQNARLKTDPTEKRDDRLR